MSPKNPSTDGDVALKTGRKTRTPRMFRVILHNDDYTTMEFVIMVLETVFHKTAEDAAGIMLRVHNEGAGTAGVYPAQIAETKVDTVHLLARRKGFPLKCSMEPE